MLPVPLYQFEGSITFLNFESCQTFVLIDTLHKRVKLAIGVGLDS